nr:hypothetical protein [Tanacetum cinerariifolium]
MAMRLLALICPKWSATTATKRDTLLGSAELHEMKITSTRKAHEGSDQSEEGPNFALLAFTSSSSDSKFLHHSSANSWQWNLHSSGSGNTLRWQWELILPVGTLSWQWECLVHFIPNNPP